MISVLLPMLRAKYIGWLPFEGLIRQQKINFEWELIIAEEQYDETFGRDRVGEYYDNLQKVGCKRIVYIPLRERITLGEKYILMVRNMDKNTEIVTIHSADSYSPPLRLYRIYHAFQKEPETDWFKGSHVIFFDIDNHTSYLRVVKSSKGVYTAVRSEYLPRKSGRLSRSWKNVDKQILDSCQSQCRKLRGRKLKIFEDQSDDWKYGFHTHGFHNISIGRNLKGWYEKGTGYKGNLCLECPVNLDETIPISVMNKVRESRGFLSEHIFDEFHK